jgi:23S rRNA (uracil1939-C5)-methyltransferase
VTEPSPLHCPHRPLCPGCPLIELTLEEQLARKRALLVRALSAYPTSADVLVEQVRAAPSNAEYRVRAKLVVGERALGLFTERGHRVVDSPSCLVLRPRIARAASVLRRLLPNPELVSSVDIREVDAGVMLTLATAADPGDPRLRALCRELLAAVPELVSLALSRRAEDAPNVLGRAPELVHGSEVERHTPDRDAPYHYAGPGAFTQAHPEQLVALHRSIEAELTSALGSLKRRRVLELYAGSGALSLRLSLRGADVVAVESFAPAVELTKRAAREQGLIVDARAADAASELVRLVAKQERFDAVLVNPPRRGVDPDVRRLIGQVSRGPLLYVSCEPKTLARDASHLALTGLGLKRAVPFDMIPLSEAVETLALFEPAAPPAPRVIHADDALIAVEKAAHEPVTPQGEHRHSLLERVRLPLDAPDAVPVHPLDLGTSGVYLFAPRPSAVAEIARALTAGRKTYLALARGINHKKGNIRRRLREEGRELEATTRYVRRSVAGGHSLLDVQPEEGRTHQIRRHLAGIGRAVIGDARYGDARTNAHFEHRYGLDRTFLHLAEIALDLGGRQLKLSAEITPDLAAVLQALTSGAPRARKTP